ncbi:ATP synthase F1 subunit delta [Petrotoga sp. 9PWA.NaAc.5.4]|uniref:ATP synthase F1 subunit delta n=1 Tax=Petrotoga sp. 9PWA.NaAc.5.4 TaxID=1434328 RepID=UPI000CB727AB|nr:ATP synthase F1 subunit delta [Petrotoga sp. 9PWA.NaAc.5.4]PNR97099.1 ATP synthase subunit delta [Petrotoga sp. 9PWA.NaAc.5.4]
MKASYYLASKYVYAFLEVLRESGEIENLDNFVEAFQKIVETVEKDESIRDIVYSPLLPYDYIVDKLLEISGLNNNIFRNFLRILVQKRRQQLIPLISSILHEESLELKKVVEVKIVLSKKISNELLKDIKNVIHNKTGRKIKLITEYNEEIIGGLQLYIGDKFFDYSVKGFLENIQSAYAPTAGGEFFEG